MGALLTLLIIAIASLLIVRVGTMALCATGMGYDAAIFQACSAFFGVGFTTREAESVMLHPVRRRIITHLIILGNIGLTSALATLIVTFTQTHGTRQTVFQLVLIVIGAASLFAVTRLRFVKKMVDFTIDLSLRHSKVLRVHDYELLLRVGSGYCLSHVHISSKGDLVGKTLAESRPSDDGIIILGIERPSGSYIGAPGPKDTLELGDIITVYGLETKIFQLIKEQETTFPSGSASSRDLRTQNMRDSPPDQA